MDNAIMLYCCVVGCHVVAIILMEHNSVYVDALYVHNIRQANLTKPILQHASCIRSKVEHLLRCRLSVADVIRTLQQINVSTLANACCTCAYGRAHIQRYGCKHDFSESAYPARKPTRCYKRTQREIFQLSYAWSLQNVAV